ncbi:MAG: pantetheine-phosphate adenylyltransferase [Chlorobi bacterium]|nr:pantetheine-phosphate adenylyltransferase [Chlorobiota bacterium]
MNNIAVFPGSFDPFTTGHESIVKRALPLFDKIIIAIGFNTNKKDFFPLVVRENWIKKVFVTYENVEVVSFEGLTIDFCKKTGAKYLLRGLRTAMDFEYERSIAQMNKYMSSGIESVFLLTTPELTPVNSTIVRDIIRHGGDASQFLPKEINLEDYKI